MLFVFLPDHWPWLGPAISIMSLEYASEYIEKGFQFQRAIQNGECAFTQRLGETPRMFTGRTMTWLDDDGRWRGFQSFEQLQQLGPATARSNRQAWSGIDRDLEIDHRYVDRFTVDDSSRLIA